VEDRLVLPDCPRLPRALFWSVLVSTAGVFVAISVWSMTRPYRGPNVMSSAGLLRTLAVEVGMAIVWVPVLRRRGWRLALMTRPWATLDVFRGVGLLLGSLAAYAFTWYLAASIAPEFVRLAAQVAFAGRPDWGTVLLVAVINAVAEEFLYLGFVMRALDAESSSLALAAGVVVRVLVHLYQGPLAILSLLPAGLVFGIYYQRSSRIWPVVLAHGLMDFWALGRLAGA
jgi:uncharacterized protein